MAALTALSFASSLGQQSELRKWRRSSNRLSDQINPSAFQIFGLQLAAGGGGGDSACFRTHPNSRAKSFQCMAAESAAASSAAELPTVSETKSNFLKAYKRPIPSVYNTVLQELIVQQHLMRYKRTYQYDPIFALGFVTVYDQLMEGYPSNEDRDEIFKSYIEALKEDPERYRNDAKMLEEWARGQNSTSLVQFASREGDVEASLKDISERAGSKGKFSYSRFFAVGLFRLLELSNATDPAVLEKLCAALNISKRSVDRDLDVYRNLLSKLVQAKELLREYVDREKKKRDERSESQKASEAVTNCMGDFQYARN